MKLLRILAVSEIVGGVLLLLVLPLTLVVTEIPIPTWYTLLSTILGLYAVVAGTLVWKDVALGRWLSLVLQAVQIFQIATSDFLFKVLVGFHVSVFMHQRGGFSITPE